MQESEPGMCSCAPFPKIPECGDIPWDRNHGMLPNYPPLLGCKFLWSFSSQKIPLGTDKRLELGLIPGKRENS